MDLSQEFDMFQTYQILILVNISAAKLPNAMSSYYGGPKMSPTPDGKSVILTYEKQIYRLNCQKGCQCTWEALPNELQISRQYHIQLTVPKKVLNNC